MSQVSQKNCHISFENQYVKQMQASMKPRHPIGAIGEGILLKILIFKGGMTILLRHLHNYVCYNVYLYLYVDVVYNNCCKAMEDAPAFTTHAQPSLHWEK